MAPQLRVANQNFSCVKLSQALRQHNFNMSACSQDPGPRFEFSAERASLAKFANFRWLNVCFNIYCGDAAALHY